MERKELRSLLKGVANGDVLPEDAERALRMKPFDDLGFAEIDNHRGIRQGVSEIVYGEGKTATQIKAICASMIQAGQKRILMTRLDKDKAEQLEDAFGLAYDATSRIGIIGDIPKPDGQGRVIVAAAGTSDLPVAEEAALTSEVLGNETTRLYDVGVAGIHRLFAHLDDLLDARVIIAVAGMEGALPSVIAGLVACPVIAVPTSVGYGAAFNGVTALLAMLNSCASGVSVVNIDNGFGGAYQASIINHLEPMNSTNSKEIR